MSLMFELSILSAVKGSCMQTEKKAQDTQGALYEP